jgi:hypothetical protein
MAQESQELWMTMAYLWLDEGAKLDATLTKKKGS